MKNGIIYRGENEIFKYIGWPTVCRDENGVLYAACSGHRISHICPFGKNYLFISSDEGETWSCPSVISDTALDDRDAGILSLGDGKLLMTYFNHPRSFYIDNAETHASHVADRASVELHWELYMGTIEYLKKMPEERNIYGSFVRLSDDNGRTWGKSIKVPVSAPHEPIKLRDGRLLYVGKEFYSDRADCKGDILAYESLDGGKTWEYVSRIKDTTGYQGYIFTEPHAVELENGMILCGIRVQEGDGITVHICHSYDGGKSWSEIKPLGNCGAPPHFLLHSSGAIILSYGRRKAPFGQRALISYDGGETFEKEVVLRDNATHGDLGYPSTVELSDGSLLTVYYQSARNDDPFRSLLYTKWRLEDILTAAHFQGTEG